MTWAHREAIPAGLARRLAWRLALAGLLLGGVTCTRTSSPKVTACASDAGASRDNGQTCGCMTDCKSGFCVDGICCDSACDGTCMSCGLASTPGICSPVPAGVKPRLAAQCPAVDVSTCGLDGTCDGAGRCESYPFGKICKPGSCDRDTVSGTYRCDGNGRCGLSSVTVCAPFSCDPASSQCFPSCVSDANCVAGHKCESGSCGQKTTGAMCLADTECASGHCADGYCCNTSCVGACTGCNLTGHEGTCWPIAKGNTDSACPAQDRTTCGTTGDCDGHGSCTQFPRDTTICQPAACASATMVNSARTCDGLGTCRDGDAQSCGTYRCIAGLCKSPCVVDADCADGYACASGSCGVKVLGQGCTADVDCQSQHCVDGVCCAEACTGSCRSCAFPGPLLGHCANAVDGAPDPRRACVDMSAASCGTDGLCDGAGACRTYPVHTTCGPESCASDVSSAVSTCNASHQCLRGPTASCGAYHCNGAACFSSCSDDGQCVAPSICLNGSCGKKAPPAPCSADGECTTGHCAQGLCCDTACTGACQACDVPGSPGRCSSIGSGPDRQGKCVAQPMSTCGTTGDCRAGACAVWAAGSPCGAASCADASTQRPRSTCDGAGTCASPATMACAPGRCDPGTAACTNVCTLDSQCTAPGTCVNGSCGLQPRGGTCSATAQCTPGLTCSIREGVCCDTACNGVCETCRPPNLAPGTCAAVAAGTSDPSGICVTSATTTCGLNGLCKGNNTGLVGTERCQTYGTAIPCRSQSCAGGMVTASATCNGGGACPAPSVASCGAYVCLDTAQCRQDCRGHGDADCNGVTCNTVLKTCGDKLAAGQACGLDTDCSSAHCADGVCCNAACAGACRACNLPGSVGTCSGLPDGATEPLCAPTADPCGNTGLCAAGACQQGICPAPGGTGGSTGAGGAASPP